MDTITLGDVTVTRVREYYGPVGMTPEAFVPDSPAQAWDTHRSWLVPDFLDAETRIVNTAIQTWVLRSEGRTILVDTGVGNHKDRPYAPVWSRLETDFLANLARAGVQPEDVDIVINTHLHIDHVGWNTYLDGRTWVPTFPNATYLMAKADFDYWNPANEIKTLLGRGNQNVFEDSVAPCTRPVSPGCGRTATASTPTCASSSHPATPPARRCCGWSPAPTGACSSAT